MMGRFIQIFLALIVALPVSARDIPGFECGFTQTKHVKMLDEDSVSSGKMLYRHPATLRWEYTSPFSSVFMIDDGKVSLVHNGVTKTVKAGNSKLYKEVSNMIFSCVSGKILADTLNFSITKVSGAAFDDIRLVPLRNEFKRMWSGIDVRIDNRTGFARSVRIQESSGDYTVVEFSNISVKE